MSDPAHPPGRTGAAGVFLSVAVLVVCALGGSVVYRLVRPTSVAHPVAPATAPEAPLAAAEPTPPDRANAGPPATSSPAPRKVPEALPDVTLPGLDGRPHRLSDWKGHALLVNFWASWCEPCRREIPLLESLRGERHSKDGLEILGIALDFQDAAEKYVRNARIDYPVLVGEQGGYEAVAAFGMEPVLPFSVFADRTGRVVALKVGELHRDEAGFILDRVREVDSGRLSLPAAREQIASGLKPLNLLRIPGTRAAH